MKKYIYVFLMMFPFIFSAAASGTELGSSYVCGRCGYVYNPEKGDSKGDIAPGTPFKNLPEDWRCPRCKEGKEIFKPVNE